MSKKSKKKEDEEFIKSILTSYDDLMDDLEELEEQIETCKLISEKVSETINLSIKTDLEIDHQTNNILSLSEHVYILEDAINETMDLCSMIQSRRLR